MKREKHVVIGVALFAAAIFGGGGVAAYLIDLSDQNEINDSLADDGGGLRAGNTTASESFAKIDTTFASLLDRSVSPWLAAAAWQRLSAKKFAAAVCIGQHWPRFATGCHGDIETHSPRSVRTIVLSLEEYDPAAFALSHQLDGTWTGALSVLRVDRERAQANLDQDLPFKWERFLVREFSSGTLLFTIGAELFEARLQPDSIVLTGSAFRGEHAFWRTAQSSEPGR